MRTELALGAWVDLQEAWLSPAEAEQLQRALVAALRWEQRHIVLFGKQVLQPRLIAWAGALPYRYSGQTLEPREWPAQLVGIEALCTRVCELAGAEFNHVLINRYRDGQDSMGYHADAEPELGSDPVVATLSLGQTRRFLLRPQRRVGQERPLTLQLTSGSLLVMGGSCQRHYRHAVPREAIPREAIPREAIPREPNALIGERLSLTFRRLQQAPRE